MSKYCQLGNNIACSQKGPKKVFFLAYFDTPCGQMTLKWGTMAKLRRMDSLNTSKKSQEHHEFFDLGTLKTAKGSPLFWNIFCYGSFPYQKVSFNKNSKALHRASSKRHIWSTSHGSNLRPYGVLHAVLKTSLMELIVFLQKQTSRLKI